MFQDSLLDTGDHEEENETVHVECEDNSPPFKPPGRAPKRVRKNEDSAAQQAVNCLKSLTQVVSSRDEYAVFGEYVANKLRNCNKSRMEIALAQRNINDVLFKLDMGFLASEIPPIQMPRPPSTSSVASTSHVSEESYSSNPSAPTGIYEIGEVQIQQLESGDDAFVIL